MADTGDPGGKGLCNTVFSRIKRPLTLRAGDAYGNLFLDDHADVALLVGDAEDGETGLMAK